MNKSLNDSIYLLRGYNRLLRPYRRQYSVVLLGIATQMVFYTFYPLIFKKVFDVVIPSRQLELLFMVVAEVLVLLVVCGLGAFFQTKYMAKTGALVMRDLREGMVAKLSILPFSFFSNLDKVDLLSRFSSDMDRVENSLTRALPCLIENVLVTLGCIITVFFIDWRLAVAAAVLLPVGFIGNIVLGPKEDTLNSESRRQKNHMLSSVEDVINSWLLIRAFNDKNHMKGRFDLSSTTYAKTASNYSYYLNLMPIVSEFVVSFSLAAIVVLGAVFAMKGALTVGAFIGAFALLRKIADGSGQSARYYTTFVNAVRPYKRIEKLMQEKVDLEHPDAREVDPLGHAIRFENVRFAYTPGNVVLKGVDFSIDAGQSVAIVGGSGTGKSSILKLLLRIIEPESGAITYDGAPLNLATANSIRQATGCVLQESHLFRGTITENITFGLDVPMEDVISAAQRAEIHHTILGLPQGYDTVVDDIGSSLSGGQRQRIAIARAFVRNPPILLLDEPTSMLDPITEAAINHALMELTHDRTVVMVTHRLASARNFDKILVLDQGSIVEQGTHEDLLLRGGHYHKLLQKQSGFSFTSGGWAKVSPQRLQSIPIFTSLDLETLSQLADEFGTETYEPGSTVIHEGAVGDKFYITVRGSLQVLQRGPDGCDRQLAVLGDGDHFGEIALLKSVPRTATLKTLSHTSCLSLSRDRFNHLVASQPEVMEALQEAMADRTAGASRQAAGTRSS